MKIIGKIRHWGISVGDVRYDLYSVGDGGFGKNKIRKTDRETETDRRQSKETTHWYYQKK